MQKPVSDEKYPLILLFALLHFTRWTPCDVTKGSDTPACCCLRALRLPCLCLLQNIGMVQQSVIFNKKLKLNVLFFVCRMQMQVFWINNQYTYTDKFTEILNDEIAKNKIHTTKYKKHFTFIY